MFRDHPVLGVGLGQYKDNYQQKYILPQAKEPYLTHAHNNFLPMLAENGIIGFAGFFNAACWLYWLFFQTLLEGKQSICVNDVHVNIGFSIAGTYGV